jgi:hypothetical protein
LCLLFVKRSIFLCVCLKIKIMIINLCFYNEKFDALLNTDVNDHLLFYSINYAVIVTILKLKLVLDRVEKKTRIGFGFR